ncbi:hypothetical protein D9M72_570920 [compost metagenome]
MRSLSAVRFCISLRAASADANALLIDSSRPFTAPKIGFQANFLKRIKKTMKIIVVQKTKLSGAVKFINLYI